jgi:hypothetical protein
VVFTKRCKGFTVAGILRKGHAKGQIRKEKQGAKDSLQYISRKGAKGKEKQGANDSLQYTFHAKGQRAKKSKGQTIRCSIHFTQGGKGQRKARGKRFIAVYIHAKGQRAKKSKGQRIHCSVHSRKGAKGKEKQGANDSLQYISRKGANTQRGKGFVAVYIHAKGQIRKEKQGAKDSLQYTFHARGQSLPQRRKGFAQRKENSRRCDASAVENNETPAQTKKLSLHRDSFLYNVT